MESWMKRKRERGDREIPKQIYLNNRQKIFEFVFLSVTPQIFIRCIFVVVVAVARYSNINFLFQTFHSCHKAPLTCAYAYANEITEKKTHTSNMIEKIPEFVFLCRFFFRNGFNLDEQLVSYKRPYICAFVCVHVDVLIDDNKISVENLYRYLSVDFYCLQQMTSSKVKWKNRKKTHTHSLPHTSWKLTKTKKTN